MCVWGCLESTSGQCDEKNELESGVMHFKVMCMLATTEDNHMQYSLKNELHARLKSLTYANMVGASTACRCPEPPHTYSNTLARACSMDQAQV